jgi:hypothetical protein
MSLGSNDCWMKLGEAAFALGVSEITLRRKVKLGKIPYEFRDGKYFIRLKKDEESGKYVDGSPVNYVHTMRDNAPFSVEFETRVEVLRQELSAKEKTIRELRRIVEDQATLISFLEQAVGEPTSVRS